MLVQCVECGRHISDKATCCPHCGCPINTVSSSSYCSINGSRYNLTEILETYLKVGGGESGLAPVYLVNLIKDKTPLDTIAAKKLACIIIETKAIPTEFTGAIETRTNCQLNSPHCPTCGSANIKSISTTERAASVIGLGLFSKKINKSFKCKNCGYTW